MLKAIKTFTAKLLDQLDIKPQDISVSKDKSGTYQIQLNLDEKDTGILIGYHGDTIAALQLIIGLLVYKQKQSWQKLVVNINDYRQRRQESLETMAQDTADRVLQHNEPIALFNLNPFERRQVHMFLSKNPQVVTESQGEGPNRHLIVYPKSDEPTKKA